MQTLLERLTPIVRVTRVSAAFAAVANAWFTVFWTRAWAQEPGNEPLLQWPLWILLLGVTANTLGLFCFGMCLNDILDLRRDRLLNPDRPLPAGALTVGAAIGLVSWSLMLAILGAIVCGTSGLLLTLLLAGAILIFNGAARFVPGFGLVAYGLIYAGAMLVPNPSLAFLWPVWLVMTHAIVLGGLTHRLGRKMPPISRRAAAAVLLGWLFWTVVLVAVMWRRLDAPWPEWAPATTLIGPAVVIAFLGLAMWRKVRSIGPTPIAAEKFTRYGTVAMSFLAGAWLVGAGLNTEGMSLLAFAAAGYLGTTIVREVHALQEHPIGYRR